MSIIIQGNVKIGGGVVIGNTTVDLTQYYVTNTTNYQLITEDGNFLIE
jgi:hypothetical protein